MEPFKVIIVEDVKLELKGTEEIFRTDIPEATIIGTAQNESELWPLMRAEQPDLLLLDLGLGGSTTIGVDICRQVRHNYPKTKVLIFTGEILNERLWVDVLQAGVVFNQPILEKIVARFKKSVVSETRRTDAVIDYDIDEYDERFLRHLALGYTKDMIAALKGMPFGVKSLEKRQVDLVNRLFPQNERIGVNATRLVVKALQLHIIDLERLEPDEE